MPATGIEPVREYKSRRILSPVRLPVPPHRLGVLLIIAIIMIAATRMGFEPTTSAVTGRRSNQLSHQAIISRIKRKWTFGDSNPGPTGYEPVALTNWAKGPKSRQSESNQQPADYKSAALPLSHVGNLNHFLFCWWLQGDLNPWYHRERVVS